MFLQSFSFIPLIASEEKIFYYFFRKFSVSVAMATNQVQRFGKKIIWLVEDYSRNISVNFCQNICCEIAISANCYLSHYTSTATVSCHSNQSSYLIGNKQTNKKKSYSFPRPIDAICEIW